METLFIPVHGDSQAPCTQLCPCEPCMATLSTERQGDIMEAAHEMRAQTHSEQRLADRCAFCKNYDVVHATERKIGEYACDSCDNPILKLSAFHKKITLADAPREFAIVAITLSSDSDAEFGLGMVVRDQAGYTPLPDYFSSSNSREKMNAHAHDLNVERGLSQETVDAIVFSSMRAQNTKTRAAIGPVHAC